jgi:hypothetical protein
MFSGSAITGETGIDMEELERFFKESDYDNSNTMNLAEFERLMMSTGLYVPEMVVTRVRSRAVTRGGIQRTIEAPFFSSPQEDGE